MSADAVDVYSKKKEPVRVPFDAEKINTLLGTDISEEDMLGYFKKIDLGLRCRDKRSDRTDIPSGSVQHWLTLQRKLQDSIGYDNIPTTLPSGEATTGKLSIQA